LARGAWSPVPLGAAALVAALARAAGPGPRQRRGCARWAARERRDPKCGKLWRRAEGRGVDAESVALTDRPDVLPEVPEDENLELAFQQRVQESLLKVGKGHRMPITKWNDTDWKYFDIAMIYVKGGDGGRGCKSFRREKNVPFGGPDGGNGGHGGNVYLKCKRFRNDLRDLKSVVHWYADDGVHGKGKKLDGKNGKHRVICVPPGVCVYVRDSWIKGQPKGKSAGLEELVCHEDVGTRHFVGELTEVGQSLRVARGGVGGRGNLAFKTHHNTAPWISELGSKGLGRWIELELKMMADIGIIGVPNAGKSSLLSAVTNKEAKIAAYPFTTVVPNVGFYRNDVHGGLVLCDVPGLIEGAHEGRGMGIQFLRHIERCRTLIHVISGDSENPLRDFDQIQAELREHGTEVATKPQVVVVNKCDIPEVQEQLPELMAALRRRCGHSRVFDISVATRYHVDDLMKRVCKWHRSILEADWAAAGGPPSDDASLVLSEQRLVMLGSSLGKVAHREAVELDPVAPKGRRLKKGAIEPRVEWDVLDEAWRLKHPEVERVAASTNWDFPDATKRFNRVCKATGMTEALAAQSVKDGDVVIVGTHKFHYNPGMVGGESRMLIYEMDLDF